MAINTPPWFFPCDPPDNPATPRKRGRPKSSPQAPIGQIDLNSLAVAEEAAKAESVPTDKISYVAHGLNEAWGAYQATSVLFKRLRERTKGRPRSAQAAMIADVARVLANAGLSGGIHGDNDRGGAPSLAVRLARAMIRRMTGRNAIIAKRQIRQARTWRGA